MGSLENCKAVAAPVLQNLVAILSKCLIKHLSMKARGIV
jgi:hypothetical protein